MPVQHDFVDSGSFQLASNWSNGAPTAMDDAVIAMGINAFSTGNETVNSISTATSTSNLIISTGTFTATDGTNVNLADSNNPVSGNNGSIFVEVGANLTIGDAFDNVGTLTLGDSTTNGGASTLHLTNTVTFSGYSGATPNFGQTPASGIVNLGKLVSQAYTTGNITGSGLTNHDNAIIGGGNITLTSLDNKVLGSIQATQPEADDLAISVTGTFTNEGYLEVGTLATMELGAHGQTESMTNTGTIGIGASGGNGGEQDADLAISGNYTLNGAGTLAFKGAGAQILSDGQGPDTFTNGSVSTIDAQQSGTIGDAGAYGAVEDLTFDNAGTVLADGASGNLTLDTGANVIGDGGGTLEAENGGTLVIDSAVTTGQIFLIPPAPPGGTIEANAGSTVDINSSVTDGVSTIFPSVSGQVVALAGGKVVIGSHASVSVLTEIDGKSGSTAGGVVELQSGGSITGSVKFVGAGGTLALASTSAANAIPLLNGLADGDAIELPGSSVTSADIGSNSITITTNLGTATFNDVLFSGAAPGGYVVTQDQTTGLMKLTFEASPVITGAASASASGNDIDAGKTVTFTLQTSTPVTVNASGALPSLQLNDGETAVYSGPTGSPTQSLTFSYTVQASDNVADLQATAFNTLPAGATIQDGAGASLDTTTFATIDTGVTVDTTPPGAPTGLADAAIVGGYVNMANDTSAQTLNGSAEANSTVTVFDNGTQLGTTMANGSGAWSYALGVLADGAQSLTATATDAAGNVSATSAALTFTVDTTAPAAPMGLADASIVGGFVNTANDSSAQKLTGSAEAGATVTVFDNGTQLGTATADGTGAWSYTLGVLANGAQSLTATATDAAGNVGGASGALAFTVETTNPDAPTGLADAAIVGGFVTAANDTSAQMLMGSALAGETITVYDNGLELGTTTAEASGAWSYALGVLANGAQSLTATATDAADNVSGASSPLDFTVDIVPSPTIASAGVMKKKAWALKGTAAANETITVYDGSKMLGTTTASASGAWQFQTKENDSKARNFTATATDAHSSVSEASGDLVEGTPGNNAFAFVSGAALLGLAGLYGNGGADTINITGDATVIDADFADVHGVHILKLAGGSSATLGADAAKAGIVAVKIGAGATSITDTLGKALTIATTALGAALTLAGNAKFMITGLKAGVEDVISGFAHKDVFNFSASPGITTFEGALASPTAMVAADSVAYFYDASLNATLLFANPSATSLAQTSSSLIETELAGGHFNLTAANFKLA